MGYKDSDWLQQKYSEEGLTEEEIADECGVTQPTIHRWLNKYNINTRSTGYQQKEGPYKDNEWLETEYVEKRNTIREIAEECDVSRETIRHYLHKYNIPIRDNSEAIETQWKDNLERRKKQSEWMKEIREKAPQLEEGWSEEMIEHMSKIKRGEKNPQWKGGPVGYYGGSWLQKRKEILKRDDYTCQACGYTDESNHVHHVKPVRDFDEPQDAHYDSNLVTLCVSCHSEAEARKSLS